MSALAVPALNRRQRIMRVIAPQPLPLGFVPLLTTAHHEYLLLGDRMTTIEARQATMEQVTLPHVAMLEDTWPSRARLAHTFATNAIGAMRDQVQACSAQANRAEETLCAMPGRGFRARLRWLLGK